MARGAFGHRRASREGGAVRRERRSPDEGVERAHPEKDRTGVGEAEGGRALWPEGRSRLSRCARNESKNLRVPRGTRTDALKLQDVDSRAPRSECLYRLHKIWGGNLYEFRLRACVSPHAEEEHWHRHRFLPSHTHNLGSGSNSSILQHKPCQYRRRTVEHHYSSLPTLPRDSPTRNPLFSLVQSGSLAVTFASPQ